MKRALFFMLIAVITFPALNAAVYQRSSSTKSMRQISEFVAPRHSQSITAVQNADIKSAPEGALEVPFSHSMGKNDATTALYKIVDANADGRTWKASLSTAIVCMKPNVENILTMDDWLISPPIHLLAGKTYLLTFSTSGALSSSAEELLEVKMGDAAEISAMTTTVLETYSFSTSTYVDKEAVISVDADGYYYIGFHGLSEQAKSGNIRLKNVAVAEKSLAELDPPAAGTLSYVLAPKGELRATVTYTAPTLTKSGNPLEKITKVEVKSAWGYDVVTIDDINPGESRTFDMKMLQGGSNNRFEATAYIDDTPGETLVIKDIYCGYDNPLPPANVKTTLSSDFKSVTLSWDPVGEVGENGGYVDPEKVEYYIFDAFGSYYDPAIASTKNTSYTFDYSSLTEQDAVAYQVTAWMPIEDTDYASLETTSDIVFPGPADASPWKESFADTDIHTLLIVDPENTGRFVINYPVDDSSLPLESESEETQYLTSQDADNGFFYFLPYDKDASYGFFTGKIDIASLQKPVLEYFYQGKGSVLEALVSTGGEWQMARSIDLMENPTDGWTLAQIDLSEYKTAGYVQLKFRVRAIHNDEEHTWSVLLDNIRVRNLVNSDIAVAAVAAPGSVHVGSAANIVASIENLGNSAATATVSLISGDKVICETTVENIAAYSVVKVTLEDTPSLADNDVKEYTIKADYSNDEFADNNSIETSVKVIMPAQPTVTDLQASLADNIVTLTWTAPEYQNLAAATDRVEDFESDEYTPLTIENFGDWTMIDVDKAKTYTFMQDENNPYRTYPMAFQLYNPVLAGVHEDYLVDATPHSGNTMLVGWSAVGLNDNWLISPTLTGNEQTISFWALGFTVAYPESFEVLYSTSNMDIESFTRIENVVNYPENGIVPETWTEYKATLPEGAKYFAIRMTSNDSYALYIDDISFMAAGAIPADTELVGYNIYLDGNKLNENPIQSTTFVDSSEKTVGEHAYRVSAVYNNAESRLCDPVVITIEDAGITSICNDNSAPVEYYNLQGIRINKLIPGSVVIRRQGSTATKQIVK